MSETATIGVWRRRRPRRRVLGGVLVVALAVAAAVVATTVPFGGGAGPGTADNGAATALATVTRRPLSSQTQVSGTLGYADSATLVAPTGTAPSDLQKAQQQVAAAQASLQAAQAALAADQTALSQAQAKLEADRLKQATDCSGDNAAAAPSSSSSAGGASPCSTAAQAVATDQQAVTSGEQKVTADDGQVSSGRASLTAAEQSLAHAQSSATAFGSTSTYTMLPAVGAIVRRGRPLYAVDGQPVLLLYGSTTAWRPLAPGTRGPDVAELNRNLRALGYGPDLAGDEFTSATEDAVRALQKAHGLDQTGSLPLGSVLFQPGAVRVTSVTPTVGAAVQQGPVLTVTSTRRVVTMELDAGQQAQVKVGDPVVITLPSNRTTPGRISFVGTVATTPSGQNGSSSAPTIEVDATPTRPAETGRLDQAPVQVSITTASVPSALVVPVDALLALAGGGYAVETVDAAGVHSLVAVDLGLFDDADGLVQVAGSGLRAGMRVVVPST